MFMWMCGDVDHTGSPYLPRDVLCLLPLCLPRTSCPSVLSSSSEDLFMRLRVHGPLGSRRRPGAALSRERVYHKIPTGFPHAAASRSTATKHTATPATATNCDTKSHDLGTRFFTKNPPLSSTKV